MVTDQTPVLATYHIGAVAKLTGVSTHTIRVWERRYGAVSPRRSPGGTREYTEDDVDKLTLLKTLTDADHSIGQIAGLSVDELRPLLDAARDRGLAPATTLDPQAAAVHRFLAALDRMDMEAAERVLLDVSQVVDPLSIVFDIMAPIVNEIGERWARGDLRISQEHAATATIRNFLGSFMRLGGPRDDAPVAAATTLSGEDHELGALMSAFVATVNGWRTIYLGPNLPVAEIVHVAETTGASLVLLSLVNERDDNPAEQLRDLLGALPENTRLLAGGRAASEYDDILAPDQKAGPLRELYKHLGKPAPGSEQ